MIMIKYRFPGSRDALLEILPHLAWIVSGAAGYEQLTPSDPNRWSIDLLGNNWWVALDDGVVKIAYRYSTGLRSSPDYSLGVLLDRIWSRA